MENNFSESLHRTYNCLFSILVIMIMTCSCQGPDAIPLICPKNVVKRQINSMIIKFPISRIVGKYINIYIQKKNLPMSMLIIIFACHPI